MLSPILQNLLQNISANMANTALLEKVDNPYWRGALQPLIDAFLQSVMNSITPQTKTQNVPDKFIDSAILAMPQ